MVWAGGTTVPSNGTRLLPRRSDSLGPLEGVEFAMMPAVLVEVLPAGILTLYQVLTFIGGISPRTS